MFELNEGSEKFESFSDPSLGDLVTSVVQFSDFIKCQVMALHQQVGESWMVQTHYDILQNLNDSGDLTMSQLANRIHRTGPTVTALVKKLKAHGYLETYKTPEDERFSMVRLSDKGSRQAEWARNSLSDFETSLPQSIDPIRIQEAIQLMSQITAMINQSNTGVTKK